MLNSPRCTEILNLVQDDGEWMSGWPLRLAGGWCDKWCITRKPPRHCCIGAVSILLAVSNLLVRLRCYSEVRLYCVVALRE